MLAPADSWVWDPWLADDGERYHLFFLFASKALPHPDDRHFRASIGHAVSTDLMTRIRVQDALVRADRPAVDDGATWTGSVIRGPEGTWYMFYTGGSFTDTGFAQTIDFATSPDLLRWKKFPDNPALRADGVCYETLPDSQWREEEFRDPWVFPESDGSGWHMLITARMTGGPADDRGWSGTRGTSNMRRN